MSITSQCWALESDKLAGCYYTEEKIDWMNQSMTLVTAILITKQANQLQLRAEFDHIHACRIYDHRNGKAILLQKKQNSYDYHYRDDEYKINCRLSLIPKDDGFVIQDHDYQCRELWECGARAGVDHIAKKSDKAATIKPCVDYFASKKPVVR